MAGRIVHTAEETERQIAHIEHAMIQAWTEARIIRVAIEQLHITKSRTLTLIARVRERWAAEESRYRDSNKAAAIRRAFGHLELARGRRDPNNPNVWLEKPDWSAVVALERHIADLQGTREPVQVNVDVRMTQAMSAVFVGLQPEQVADLMREGLELERDAQSYRALLGPAPAPANGVAVNGKAAS